MIVAIAVLSFCVVFIGWAFYAVERDARKQKARDEWVDDQRRHGR